MKSFLALFGDALLFLEYVMFHVVGGGWEVLLSENNFLGGNLAPVIHNVEMEYNFSSASRPGKGRVYTTIDENSKFGYNDIWISNLTVLSNPFYSSEFDDSDKDTNEDASKEKEVDLSGENNNSQLTDYIWNQKYIPQDINGMYARIGPNPLTLHQNYHWFDGDGMIHSIHIDTSRDIVANYSAHQIVTNRLKEELWNNERHPSVVRVGDLQTGAIKLFYVLLRLVKEGLGLLDTSKGMGSANTNVIYHHGELLALVESDQPYRLNIDNENGKITTDQRVLLTQKETDLETVEFTAHPKISPKDKSLYAFRYKLKNAPYLFFTINDAEGNLLHTVPLNHLETPTMVHDFIITENYAVFFEPSLVFKKEAMLSTKPCFQFDENKKMKWTMMKLPVSSSSNNTTEEETDNGKECLNEDEDGTTRILGEEQENSFSYTVAETRPSMIFHIANAWESLKPTGPESAEKPAEKLINVLAVKYNKFSLSFPQEETNLGHLVEYVLNADTGEVVKEDDDLLTRFDTLAKDKGIEFPQINPNYLTKKTRFIYASLISLKKEDYLQQKGLVKIDLTLTKKSTVKKFRSGRTKSLNYKAQEIYYQKGWMGSELIFVPRTKHANDQPKKGKQMQEDDGYLVTFVTNPTLSESEFHIYDAKFTNPNDPLISKIKIPNVRIPNGFHALFVPQYIMNEKEKKDRAVVGI